eukprot:Pgem_evm2s4769
MGIDRIHNFIKLLQRTSYITYITRLKKFFTLQKQFNPDRGQEGLYPQEKLFLVQLQKLKYYQDELSLQQDEILNIFTSKRKTKLSRDMFSELDPYKYYMYPGRYQYIMTNWVEFSEIQQKFNKPNLLEPEEKIILQIYLELATHNQYTAVRDQILYLVYVDQFNHELITAKNGMIIPQLKFNEEGFPEIYIDIRKFKNVIYPELKLQLSMNLESKLRQYFADQNIRLKDSIFTSVDPLRTALAKLTFEPHTKISKDIGWYLLRKIVINYFWDTPRSLEEIEKSAQRNGHTLNTEVNYYLVNRDWPNQFIINERVAAMQQMSQIKQDQNGKNDETFYTLHKAEIDVQGDSYNIDGLNLDIYSDNDEDDFEDINNNMYDF